MQKKIIVAACGLLASSVVCANDLHFYVGGAAGYNKFNYYSAFKNFVSNNNGSLKSKVPSIGVFAGANFHNNFGVEAGYTFYKKAKISAPAGNGSVRLGNAHVDVLGYLPFACEWDMVGAVGLGRSRVKADSNAVNGKYNKFGVRVGAGVQYNIDRHFAARAMVNYQQVGKRNGLEILKRASSFNVGLTYNI